MDNIQLKVKAFLSRLLVGDRVGHDLQLDEDATTLGFWNDEFSFLPVVDWVEKEFGIKVEDEDLLPANFSSIRAISDFVARKLAASRQ